MPKVSILIPCYNADRWIQQALASAFNQTYPNIEVIVVDDGSTDYSSDIIRGFSESLSDAQRERFHWETQLNQGGNITRNRLLELSTGEWIQYLDSDDYLQPTKIEKQVQYLNQNPQADVIYSPSIFEYWNHDTSRQEILPIPKPHDPWTLLARWYLPQTGSPLWRKQAIVDVGGWKPEQPCCQEHELYLRLLKAGKQFKYCPDAGSIYRQWSESTVCKRDKSETFRQRLAIEDAIEQHLQNTNQLTPERRYAINQARFECARTIWLSNRTWANEVITKIQQSDRSFLPSGAAAPKTYRLTYKLFGFPMAEQIATLKRSIHRSVSTAH
jgi:glycosyltransferase involved in cell wall biosynthesis